MARVRLLKRGLYLLLATVFTYGIYEISFITRHLRKPEDFDQLRIFGSAKADQRNQETLQRKTEEDSAKSISEDPTNDVIEASQLPPLVHKDIFTEFDDVVLKDLYDGINDFPNDLRYLVSENVDIRKSANATFSSVRLLDPKPHYYVGDVIKMSIEVLDGYMSRVLHGSDRLFVWIKDVNQHACAKGVIEDFGNGTYRGSVRMLWPGHVTIIVGIASSRESVRVLYKIHREGVMMRQVTAIFQRRFVFEMTVCSSFPQIPGYSKVCNMTSRHHGLPWYCGHPEMLTCVEWTRVASTQPPWPLTEEEHNLFDLERLNKNIPTAISVNVYDGNTAMSKWRGNQDTRGLAPCNQISPEATWRQTTPVGFFYNWSWRSTICRNTLTNTARSWNRCLSNRRLWLLGDSTLRQWFVHLQRRQGLELVTEQWRYGSWPFPSTQLNRKHNYVVFWATHGLPFTFPSEFIRLETHTPIHAHLDKLPRGNRDIVVIHFYLHFTPFPPTVVQTHIRRAVEAVEDLKRRAPDSVVFVKGPHKFHVHEPVRGRIDDHWGPIYEQIYKEEFRRIAHLVYYLDFWDMTVSSESQSVHPNSTIVEQMLHTMLGYVCPWD